jgi:hypothetical protein
MLFGSRRSTVSDKESKLISRIRSGKDYISYDLVNILLATEMPFAYFLASSFDQYEEIRQEYSRGCPDCLDSKFKRIALNVIDPSLTFSSCDNESHVMVFDNKGIGIFTVEYACPEPLRLISP